jgi:hypothetical protein
MTTIVVEDREYKMPTTWGELVWKDYINLLNLEANKDKYIVDVLYQQRYYEVLCNEGEGVFDELEMNTELEAEIIEGFDPEKLKNIKDEADHFVINGVTYSFYSKNTIGKITFGEQGYIEIAKQREKDFDYLIKSLAVLIRPATKTITSEGLTKWKLDRFDAEDVEHRVKILEVNMKVLDLIRIYNFFLNTTIK